MNTSRIAQEDRELDQAAWDATGPTGRLLGRYRAGDALPLTQGLLEEVYCQWLRDTELER